MKAKFFVLYFFLILCCNVSCANSLDEGIQRILHAAESPAHVGIIIRSAKTGKVLYSKKSNYLFTPASVQKLFTATAALSYLGPNFTFNTKLYTRGSVNKGILNGDVLIQFSGDPEFAVEDLQQLIDALKEKHITKIRGKVYFDTSIYDHVYYPPGWLWDDLSYSYAAPLSSIILNKNSFILRLTPSRKLGKPPMLSVDIPNHIVKFTNHVITTAHYNKYCPLTIYSDSDNHYTLSGCLNKNWARQRRNLALRNPTPYAEAVIRQELKADGIHYSGKMTPRLLNAHYRLLAQHKSEPLRKILKDMLKKSDNLISDSLLKQVGHLFYKKPGSWQNGISALQKILAESHINFSQNLLDDGAGLSRYNLITPYQLTQLLQYIYKHPILHHTLIQALPIGGIDGTLVERMISEAKDKRVRAKTGSMAGVTSLAGFIHSQHLGVLSFSIMINGFIGKHRPYNRLEDKICKYLAHYNGKKTHG